MAEQDHPTRATSSLVGRRASREYWSARSGETCATALERLRVQAAVAPTAPLHFCYVVDEACHLVGCASFATVVGAPPEREIGEVMSPRVVPIPEGAPEEAIQDFFITYGMLAFPVVDRAGTLVGVVGVEHFSDLVFEGFDAQVRDEAYRSVGLRAHEVEHGSPVAAARLRLSWLLVTLCGGIVAALLLGHGGVDPGTLATMAVFLPLVVTVSERVAVRTLTVRSVWPAGEHATGPLASREMAAGVAVGALVATLSSVIAYVWHGRGASAVVLGVTIFLVVLSSSGLALVFPAVERSNARAARVVYPVALAVVDVVAVAIYLMLVRVLGP